MFQCASPTQPEATWLKSLHPPSLSLLTYMYKGVPRLLKGHAHLMSLYWHMVL